MDLPPEDQPDVINIGPVLGIPIVHEDDPRFVDERGWWSSATELAQAFHTPDQLLVGLSHEDWRVRHEVVDRLIARAGTDPRTLPALMDAVATDQAWQVRDAIVMRLHEFDADEVLATLHAAAFDPNTEVRWSAAYSLSQLEAGDPSISTESD